MMYFKLQLGWNDSSKVTAQINYNVTKNKEMQHFLKLECCSMTLNMNIITVCVTYLVNTFYMYFSALFTFHKNAYFYILHNVCTSIAS